MDSSQEDGRKPLGTICCMFARCLRKPGDRDMARRRWVEDKKAIVGCYAVRHIWRANGVHAILGRSGIRWPPTSTGRVTAGVVLQNLEQARIPGLSSVSPNGDGPTAVFRVPASGTNMRQ